VGQGRQGGDPGEAGLHERATGEHEKTSVMQAGEVSSTRRMPKIAAAAENSRRVSTVDAHRV
jgi:hypothetical protein